MTRKALTPDQVRQQFRQQGVTLTTWARQHGYPREAVYRVMGGQDKGNFGQAHRIAVDLGLKIPTDERSTEAHASGIQRQEAA